MVVAAAAALALGGVPGAAYGQKADSVMHMLLARYDRVSRAIGRYTQYESTIDSMGLDRWATGQGRFTAAFEGDTLRTIVASYTGGHGHATESYFFWHGEPFEVRVRLRDDGANAAGRVSEQRFYFSHGYLVRWIDPSHTIRPVTTGAVFARAMQLMADASRLVDAARRTRDHALTPPTPVEMAEAMRRELRTFMTAELAYYAENSRYGTDVTTVGYRPASDVQLTLIDATDRGWAARATTGTMPGKSCVAYLGKPHKAPRTAADHARPDAEREVVCDRP